MKLTTSAEYGQDKTLLCRIPTLWTSLLQGVLGSAIGDSDHEHQSRLQWSTEIFRNGKCLWELALVEKSGSNSASCQSILGNSCRGETATTCAVQKPRIEKGEASSVSRAGLNHEADILRYATASRTYAMDKTT